MRGKLSLLNSQYVGVVHDAKQGTAEVVRARLTTGHLWWKKSKLVWAVQSVRREVDCIGGNVCVDDFWRTIGVYEDEQDARALAAEVNR